MKNMKTLVSLGVCLGLIQACTPPAQQETVFTKLPNTSAEVNFEVAHIIDDAKYFWAHTAGDVTGDGIADLVFIDNNARGGVLAYYQGQLTPGKWKRVIVAKTPLTGGLFAGGDLEVADIDKDGDIDILGIKPPGEWQDAGASAEIFWYENQQNQWKVHPIGEVPDAVKDVSFADFNNDGKMDIAVLTFDSHSLSIFTQSSEDDWRRAQFIQNDTLHEGMAIGDFNADSYIDIVANGYVFLNPKGQISETWQEINLDEKWNNQGGDWSRNGTKTFVTDANEDGIDDIFICHSERAGYPLAQYSPVLSQNKITDWAVVEILPEITACHTLQVYTLTLMVEKTYLPELISPGQLISALINLI